VEQLRLAGASARPNLDFGWMGDSTSVTAQATFFALKLRQSGSNNWYSLQLSLICGFSLTGRVIFFGETINQVHFLQPLIFHLKILQPLDLLNASLATFQPTGLFSPKIQWITFVTLLTKMKPSH
jgi:hypothetical protein